MTFPCHRFVFLCVIHERRDHYSVQVLVYNLDSETKKKRVYSSPKVFINYIEHQDDSFRDSVSGLEFRLAVSQKVTK